MKGILCGTTAKTNEEYKKVIKSRMKIMVVIIIIGIITATICPFPNKIDTLNSLYLVFS